MNTRSILIAAILAATLSGPVQGRAASSQAIGNEWKLCDSAIARQERLDGIPRHLLKAISLAETGRWDAARQATFAWPWTVMARGQGHYFPDKAAALAFVRALQARGIGNIDVGCMQVNLHYHGDAFADVEQALEPAANIAYAAKYLSGLYDSAGSWTRAAGHYHSTHPERTRAYRLKVLKYWNQARRDEALTRPDAADPARMTVLNAAFKARKTAGRDGAATDQLAAWRDGGPSMATRAAMQRARKQAEWREKYRLDGGRDNGRSFAEKRRRQLRKWRLGRSPSEEG